MLAPINRPGCHHCNEQPADVPCWWCGRRDEEKRPAEKMWRFCPWCGESTSLHDGDPTMTCGVEKA